jgi:UDP:flavonoid glycosyltransferase YjiC (YdhE family)
MLRALSISLLFIAVSACDDGVVVPDPETVAPPKRAPLPTPPMTSAKAILVLDGLPLQCKSMAVILFDMSRCLDKTPAGLPDDDKLLADLVALRAEIEALDPDQVETTCSTRYAELESTPKPRECW